MEWHFEAAGEIYRSTLHADLMTILHRDGEPGADFAAAELIFGELISNAIRYANGSVTVKLDWSRDFPVLIVSDGRRDAGTGMPVIALPSDPLAESGRGLFIVKSLARAFTTRDDGSTCATLPVRRRSAHRETEESQRSAG